MESSDLSIRRGNLASSTAQGLIAQLNRELQAQYPEPGANHFRLETEDVVLGQGAFLIAYRNKQAVGCGALRRVDDHVGELKRMFIVPAARGQGHGRRLLEALEHEAAQLGLRRVVLETGARQIEAVSLYERAGYAVIPCFGEYLSSPLSLCMGKELEGSG